MSKKIGIEEVAAGMRIDKDVTNLQGAVLLRKGTEVTQRHIQVFKTWGISSVFVEEELSIEDLGGRSPQEVAEEKINNLSEVLENKFADVCSDPVMQQIKECAFQQRSSQIKIKYNV